MSAHAVDKIAELLFPVFSRHHINKAVLFGSAAKGEASDNSDLDLYVDSGLKGLQFVGLLEDVRHAVNMDVDLLDVTHVEIGSPIQREIDATGIVIYEK